MAITLQLNSKAPDRLCLVFQTRWTLDELADAQADLLEYLDRVSHRVDVIVDMQASDYPPQGVLYRMHDFLALEHPSLRAFIVVADTFNRYLLNTLLQIHQSSRDTQRLHLTSSLNGAYSFCYKT